MVQYSFSWVRLQFTLYSKLLQFKKKSYVYLIVTQETRTGVPYIDKLEQWLFYHLENLVFQQDGTPPHWYSELLNFLNNKLYTSEVGWQKHRKCPNDMLTQGMSSQAGLYEETENIEEDVSSDVNSSLAEVPKIVNNIEESITQLSSLVDSLREKLKSGQLNTSEGISLLDVKNHTMLSYLINVVYIMAAKCSGKSIEGDDAIDRLVEARTVLERIRPLEYKLKYMMEKLVKASLTGVTDENNPTQFRANPQNMVDNDDEDESESEEEEEKKTGRKKGDKAPGVYVPPKLAPVHYDEEETQATRKQKLLERAKKRALHSSVIEELREEYLDTPAEVTHGNTLRASLSRQERQRNQYEEEYFTRLPTSKKERHQGRHSMTVGNIGKHLTHFHDVQILEDDTAFSETRKRKSSGKQGKKKGFKRRKTR